MGRASPLATNPKSTRWRPGPIPILSDVQTVRSDKESVSQLHITIDVHLELTKMSDSKTTSFPPDDAEIANGDGFNVAVLLQG